MRRQKLGIPIGALPSYGRFQNVSVVRYRIGLGVYKPRIYFSVPSFRGIDRVYFTHTLYTHAPTKV